MNSISVVIPAHNESAVIARCLRSLSPKVTFPGDFEVIVVCNGCTDNTAAVARYAAPFAKVLEIDEASKPAALNAGDQLASYPSRIYLDADIYVTPNALGALAAALDRPETLGCRPPIGYDFAGASALVSHYYNARQALPVVMNSLWGAGVYGLSERARARFGEFTNVVGDDLFVDRLFKADEISVLRCDPAVVSTPRTTGDLLRVLRRAQRGKRGAGAPAHAADNTTRSVNRDLVLLFKRDPKSAVNVLAYMIMAIAARITRSAGRRTRWERDESSRMVGR